MGRNCTRLQLSAYDIVRASYQVRRSSKEPPPSCCGRLFAHGRLFASRFQRLSQRVSQRSLPALGRGMAQGDMAYFARPASSAVKIVAPSSADQPPSPKPTKKDSTQRQCRNILIYGSCKFQDKGCIYYHPPCDTPSPVPPESPVPSAALPAQAVNAPVFVPKTPLNPSSPTPAPSVVSSQTATVASSSPSVVPPDIDEEQHDPFNPFAHDADDGAGDGAQLPPMNPYGLLEGHPLLGYDPASVMEPFFTPSYYTQQPLNYHLYTQPHPDVPAQTYFISDSIREELQKRSETLRAAPAPDLNLPEELQGYHSLSPLEVTAGERRKFGNWYSSVYRAVNSTDGFTYVLRRIENFRLVQQTAFSLIEAWSRVRHPNIVSVREAFTTRAFNDSSLVVVYDYHPDAQTLYEVHIKPKAPQFQNGRLQMQLNRIPERVLWSYIIQVANAIKAVHDAGLAMRIIDPTKILVTGKNRIRIGSCGIVDVLMYESRADIVYLQQEDLAMFGKLIFSLCCIHPASMTNLPKAIDTLGRHYSADLKSVALFLISKPGPQKTIGQLFDMIGSRLLTEMDEMQNAVDRLEGELMTELENARLVRLLCKFGFINERPEFAREPRWSETGDRYIVKLFRDYVFHQVDEQGNPVVDLSHVLTCLNKLDAGTDERIMLVSRDEQSCLVVSYNEVKSCINTAFSDLSRR